MFFLKKLLAALLLPPVAPLLLVAGGLLLLRWRRRLGLGLAWTGLGVLFALSTPPVSNALLDSLRIYPPPAPAEMARAQAIVVLAGGIVRDAAEYGGADVVDSHSLLRLRYAARLHRQTRLPLLLTGGAPQGGTAEAEAMAQALRGDFSLDARWLETASLDTRDNARHSAALLREHGIATVLLVTEGLHMRRAVLEFEAAGLRVIAAPTVLGGGRGANGLGWLPGPAYLQRSTAALHEWLGIAAARLRP